MKKKLVLFITVIALVLACSCNVFAAEEHVHEYNNDDYDWECVEPTETVDGHWDYIGCTGCDMVETAFGGGYDAEAFWVTRDQIVRPATGHVKGALVEGTPATCTETGTATYYECANEGCTMVTLDDGATWVPYYEANAIEALGHKAGEKVEANNDDCKFVPYTKCANDGCDKVTINGIDWVDVPAPVKHEAGETVKQVAATCDEDGHLTYVTCKNCDLVKYKTNWVTMDEVVLKGGHIKSEKAVEAVAATCTTPGNVKYFTCERCDKVLYKTNWVTMADVTIAAHHTLDPNKVTAEKAGTCTEKGNVAYTACAGCDLVTTDEGNTWVEVAKTETPVVGHIVERKKEVTKEATCTENGLYDDIHACTVCGKVISCAKNVALAAHHTVVIDEAVPATTTSTGLTKGSHCSKCGEVLIEQLEVAKTTKGLNVKTAKKVVKQTTVKSKKVTLKGLIKVSGNDGPVTFKKVSGNKYASINASTGTITVKKHKCSCKNHNIKVQVACEANNATKTVTVYLPRK